jgi:hypothetical protein
VTRLDSIATSILTDDDGDVSAIIISKTDHVEGSGLGRIVALLNEIFENIIQLNWTSIGIDGDLEVTYNCKLFEIEEVLPVLYGRY